MSKRTYKTGESRTQGMLLPMRVEDYVSADNPVRAIDAYVASLDLAALAFGHASGGGGAGQPAYDPADLLKLYLYGYLNQVRSSRRLERETRRNLELIWLLGGVQPGYRTIATFRRDNRAALVAANRDFVLLARRLGLLGGELVAIDGAYFHGDASKASIVTDKRLTERIAALERDIAAYQAALDASDAAEADAAEAAAQPVTDIAARMADLTQRHAVACAEQKALRDSGATQLSRTDPDARLLCKAGQTVAGYNVQIAVDDKHKLIVASDVVNEGNDTGQLHAMARAAREVVAGKTLKVVADTGYYNGETLKACEDDGIVAYVPEAVRGTRPLAQGRFGRESFTYDRQADVYRCPAGEELRPMQGQREDASGKPRIRYATRRTACAACPIRARCLSDQASRRDVYRWVHQDVIERHEARMQDSQEIMRRRKELAEHPFGTLKCRAGYRHFLLRGFDCVRGEWSLMALCYNFTRLLNILGLEGFREALIAALARCIARRLALAAAAGRQPTFVRVPSAASAA